MKSRKPATKPTRRSASAGSAPKTGKTSRPPAAAAGKTRKAAASPGKRPAAPKRPRTSTAEAAHEKPAAAPAAALVGGENGASRELTSSGLGAGAIEDAAHLGVHGLGPAPGALWSPHGENERSGKYVYCIMQTSAPLRFGPIGIGSDQAEVHTVNYRDIAAVVSDTPLEVYDPTRENVLAHERVNEAVMRKYTVIPMSFNTVFKTREDIIELLRSAYDAFHDVLGKMADKLEFGLKVVWDPELVIREIEKENDNLRLLRQEISSRKGSTYFARMQYGRLVDSLLQDRSEQLVNEIFSNLSVVAVAARANKPIGDKMILNAAFLVARDREGDFDSMVKEIDAKYANLKFKYTGPWPPYNFVNIRLKLERAAEAD